MQGHDDHPHADMSYCGEYLTVAADGEKDIPDTSTSRQSARDTRVKMGEGARGGHITGSKRTPVSPRKKMTSQLQLPPKAESDMSPAHKGTEKMTVPESDMKGNDDEQKKKREKNTGGFLGKFHLPHFGRGEKQKK